MFYFMKVFKWPFAECFLMSLVPWIFNCMPRGQSQTQATEEWWLKQFKKIVFLCVFLFVSVCVDCAPTSFGEDQGEACRKHPWTVGDEQNRAGLDLWCSEYQKYFRLAVVIQHVGLIFEPSDKSRHFSQELNEAKHGYRKTWAACYLWYLIFFNGALTLLKLHRLWQQKTWGCSHLVLPSALSDPMTCGQLSVHQFTLGIDMCLRWPLVIGSHFPILYENKHHWIKCIQ